MRDLRDLRPEIEGQSLSRSRGQLAVFGVRADDRACRRHALKSHTETPRHGGWNLTGFHYSGFLTRMNFFVSEVSSE